MSLLPRRRLTTLLVALLIVLSIYYLSRHVDEYAPPSLSNAPQPGVVINDDGKFHWTKKQEQHPVKEFKKLPDKQPHVFPRLQHDFKPESDQQREERLKRRDAVKKEFLHAWNGYKEHAWMRDEVRPVTGQPLDTFGGWAATLVDTLDTLWIMGLKDEFESAIRAVKEINFSATKSEKINVFETNIRYLGGFLGAYDVSGRQYWDLLEKAKQVGELLYNAFDTPNRMPMVRWSWNPPTGQVQQASDSVLLAEIGSMSLEFTRLSQLTKRPKYFDAIDRIMTELENTQQKTYIPGLWPVLVNARAITFKYSGFTLGGMADSTYEYLPKQAMLLGGLDPKYESMYTRTVDAMKKYILFRPMVPDNMDILMAGDANYRNSDKSVKTAPQGQHLSCFVGGMIGIGAKLFSKLEDVVLAAQLTDGCIWAYDSMPLGIMPEVFTMATCPTLEKCPWSDEHWREGVLSNGVRNTVNEENPKEKRIEELIASKGLRPGYVDIKDRRYILRPEAIESVFIMYRLTWEKGYQEAAWRMFQNIIKSTKTEIAHSAIVDMTVENPKLADRMESFWLAETLKYFYLIFSEPDLISLDDYVLNTEAHPLLRPKPGPQFRM